MVVSNIATNIHGEFGNIGANQKNIFITISYIIADLQLYFCTIVVNNIFFTITGIKTDTTCLNTNDTFVIVPVNDIISNYIIVNIITVSVFIIVLSFFLVIHIILYLAYSLPRITIPVTQKFVNKPNKVFEYGFLPNVTNNPQRKYIMIYTKVATIVYWTTFFSFLLFIICGVIVTYIIIEHIIQNTGFITLVNFCPYLLNINCDNIT